MLTAATSPSFPTPAPSSGFLPGKTCWTPFRLTDRSWEGWGLQREGHAEVGEACVLVKHWVPLLPWLQLFQLSLPSSPPPPPRPVRPLSPSNCAIYRHCAQQPSLSCLSSKIFQVVMRWMSSRESREDRCLAQGLRGGLCGVFCGLPYDFQALPEEKQSQVVSGGVPWEADLEVEICTWDVYWGEVSRLGRGPLGEREEAALGRVRSWAAIQSKERSQPIPWGGLKLGRPGLSQIETPRPDLCMPTGSNHCMWLP